MAALSVASAVLRGLPSPGFRGNNTEAKWRTGPGCAERCGQLNMMLANATQLMAHDANYLFL